MSKKVLNKYYKFEINTDVKHKNIEKVINKAIATIDAKCEQINGIDDYITGDFVYHNQFIIIFIKNWDNSVEKFINSNLENFGMWNTTVTYIIYNNIFF